MFQLHLDGAELAVDDAHHALDLLGRDGVREWEKERDAPLVSAM